MTGLTECLKMFALPALTAGGLLLAQAGVEDCFLGSGPTSSVGRDAQISIDHDAGLSVDEREAAVDLDAGASAENVTAEDTTGCALDCGWPDSPAVESDGMEVDLAAEIDAGLESEPANGCGCPIGGPVFEIDVAEDTAINGDAGTISTSIDGDATIDADGGSD